MSTSKDSNPKAKADKPAKVNQFRPHPWHGLEVGSAPPEILNVFIEITPFDLVKYELDKVSGYLHVDGRSALVAAAGFVWIRATDLLRATGLPVIPEVHPGDGIPWICAC